MHKVRVRVRPQQLAYDMKIGRGTLSRLGDEARRCLSKWARRLAIISNKRVFAIYGPEAVKSLRASGFTVSHWLMGDGERSKSLRTLEKAVAFLSEAGLERNDGVVALGGGVVGDLAGFVAAVYLRGVPLIHVPTTLLAQIDSSGGGKNGVNLSVGKNLVGAFHHPSTVIIDTQTLRTLSSRELTAGWCEAVKQGAAGSRSLFDQTTKFLIDFESDARVLPSMELEELLAAQCAFKALIVAGDEREDVARIDHRSRRILNFGHTTAHALEAATAYRRFRHGEAVGYGMLVAGEISKTMGLLEASELELLRQSVRLCGPLPAAGDLDESKIIERLGKDKKSIGGQIHWVLLERIGRARIVNEREITPRLLRASLRSTLRPTSDKAIGAI